MLLTEQSAASVAAELMSDNSWRPLWSRGHVAVVWTSLLTVSRVCLLELHCPQHCHHHGLHIVLASMLTPCCGYQCQKTTIKGALAVPWEFGGAGRKGDVCGWLVGFSAYCFHWYFFDTVAGVTGRNLACRNVCNVSPDVPLWSWWRKGIEENWLAVVHLGNDRESGAGDDVHCGGLAQLTEWSAKTLTVIYSLVCWYWPENDDDDVDVEKPSTFITVLCSGVKRRRKVATCLTTVNRWRYSAWHQLTSQPPTV